MKKIIVSCLLFGLIFMPISGLQASAIDNTFAKNLAGRLLLDVENGGAIWYVDTDDFNKHSVTWDNAMNLFERLSLGISNADLAKIPASVDGIPTNLDSDHDGYSDIIEMQNGYNPYESLSAKIAYDESLTDRLKGKLLIQVEEGGAIWYVDIDGVRHLVTFDNLLPLFESLALGISEADLSKINEVGEIADGVNVDYESLLLTEEEVQSVFSFLSEDDEPDDLGWNFDEYENAFDPVFWDVKTFSVSEEVHDSFADLILPILGNGEEFECSVDDELLCLEQEVAWNRNRVQQEMDYVENNLEIETENLIEETGATSMFHQVMTYIFVVDNEEAAHRFYLEDKATYSEQDAIDNLIVYGLAQGGEFDEENSEESVREELSKYLIKEDIDIGDEGFMYELGSLNALVSFRYNNILVYIYGFVDFKAEALVELGRIQAEKIANFK